VDNAPVIATAAAIACFSSAVILVDGSVYLRSCEAPLLAR
jgi:hypothetical protein